MKNVFIFIGSNNLDSITEKLVDDLIDGLKSKLGIIIINKCKFTEGLIKCCQGCSVCFNGEVCPLDKKDSMQSIKKDLIEADIVIFATPVYFKNVSAATKLFLDRITYMTHLFFLHGAQGVILTSSSQNGNKETSDYLFDFSVRLGLINIKKIDFCYSTSNQLQTREQIYKICREISYQRDTIYVENYYQDVFKCHQYYYDSIKDCWEKEYWKKMGMLDVDSYEEYIRKMIK